VIERDRGERQKKKETRQLEAKDEGGQTRD